MPRKTRAAHQRLYILQKRGVCEYFRKKENWDAVYPFLNSCKKKRSHRFIDHLITNYARTHEVGWTETSRDGNTYEFNLYHEVQTILHTMHKRYMDPFNRKNSHVPRGGLVEFGYEGKMVKTSVCQLTLFRFLHRHGVLEWVSNEENAKLVRDDMERASKEKRRTESAADDEDEVVEITDVVIQTDDKKKALLSGNADTQRNIDERLWIETNALLHKNRKRRRRRLYRATRVNFVVSNETQSTVFDAIKH